MSNNLRSLGRGLIFSLPLIVTFTSVGFLVEFLNANPTYSTSYSRPAALAPLGAIAPYEARLTHDGWRILGIDTSQQIALSTLQSSERHKVVLDRGADFASAPSMAWRGNSYLLAWGTYPDSGSEQLRLALVTRGMRTLTTVHLPGSIAHPYVLPGPGEGYTVLFTWQRQDSPYQVFGVRIDGLGRVLGHPTRLASVSEFSASPKGWSDSDRYLQVAYFKECCHFQSFQLWLRRYTPSLAPAGTPHLLAEIPTAQLGTTPQFYGLDAQASDHGGWIAWASSSTLTVQHWNSRGRLDAEGAVSSIQFNPADLRLSLLIDKQTGGGRIYYTALTPSGAAVFVQAFSSRGEMGPPVRISYSGFADAPEGQWRGRNDAVIWQEQDAGAKWYKASIYVTRSSPPLTTRMGLGQGPLVVDLVFLIFGSLVLALPLTFVNGFLIIPLMFTWFPISRLLPARVQFLALAVLVTSVLFLVFAVKSFANGWVLLLGPVGGHIEWLVLIGALFVGSWLSQVVLRRSEAVVRSSVFVAAAVYFMSAMWMISVIEGRLTAV